MDKIVLRYSAILYAGDARKTVLALSWYRNQDWIKVNDVFLLSHHEFMVEDDARREGSVEATEGAKGRREKGRSVVRLVQSCVILMAIL